MTLHTIFNEAATFTKLTFRKAFDGWSGKSREEQANITAARLCSAAFLYASYCTYGVLPLAIFLGDFITSKLEKPWGPN